MTSDLSLNATPWRTEMRTMLSLAWPLILTNVTMVLINATDVFLLAQVGPDALAASAMGSGIVIAMMLFGIGLVIASSPMIASEIGRKKHSVRDVRRTFRQSLWAAVTITIPIWVLLWFTEDMLRAAGQPERLAADTGLFVRALQWQILPALGIVALRSFMSGDCGGDRQCGGQLRTDLWSFRFACTGVVGGRHWQFDNASFPIPLSGWCRDAAPAISALSYLWPLVAGGLAAFPHHLEIGCTDWFAYGV
jgi:hypothetical protein